jgi:hypothetical protein
MFGKFKIKFLVAVIIVSVLNTGCTKSKDTEDKSTTASVVESSPSKVDNTQAATVNEIIKPSGAADVNSKLLIKDNDYIFPESHKTKLDEMIVMAMEPEMLAFARNEIFARRGYVFTNEKYKNYFASKAWYKPNPNFKAGDLNAVENYNINLIKYFEDVYNTVHEKPEPIGNVYKANTEVLFDLNGDGAKEKIIYNLRSGELIVNNKSVKLNLTDAAEAFAIVDVDSKDKFKEILISDYGPSDDYKTCFYYFDGTNIVNMGEAEGLFDFGIKLEGSGKITARTRGNILQTWFINKSFQLSEGHKLKEISQELYTTNYPLFLKISLKLYKNKGEKAATMLINEGQKVNIIGTDDKEWCLIETSGGVKGWIAVDSFNIIRNNGLAATEVFAGLCYAD